MELLLAISLLIGAFFLGHAGSSPVLTIQSPDGDLIDCVKREEQPAFQNPLLKNHILQEPPAELLRITSKMKGKTVKQVWNLNGTRCPDQTIPVRRKTDVGDKHMAKKRHLTDARRSRQYTAADGHEYAIAYTTTPKEIYGAQATMNIWAPVVESGTGEFSLSQIWLVAGHYNESDLNTVEAGWQVFPEHYHDNQPRLFVYWTRDTYQQTGCLNLECPGFVQVASEFTIGAAFLPVSSYGGNQYDITMLIWKTFDKISLYPYSINMCEFLGRGISTYPFESGLDTDNGNWWLGIGQSFVGYWPAKLFTHLADGPARLVQWGGEITNTRSYGQHTTTHMGSGHFAEEGFGKASFFHSLRVIDYLYHLLPVNNFLMQTGNPTCYNAVKVHNAELGALFYYGGPGYNALCP